MKVRSAVLKATVDLFDILSEKIIIHGSTSSVNADND